MKKDVLLSLCLVAVGASALADSPKLPVQIDDKNTVYVAPKVDSTEKSAVTNGATVGVQRPDGAEAYGGVDTSGGKPTYSVGGATGGNVSFSGGAHSDGKANTGVKAGVTIKY